VNLADIPAVAARPQSGSILWDAVCRGVEPAESLDSRAREDLVLALVDAGWSDLEIAVLTRMSTYTTVRIRERVCERRVVARAVA